MSHPAFRILFWVVVWLGPPIAIAWGIYFLVSLPMRRQERARFFLDLLESGLEDGRAPEQTIVALSKSRDRALGARFHLLAAYIETGLRLGQAFEKVPRFLPPSVTAMLKVGEELGDVGKVLPACRQLLQDGVSQTRGAMNYLILFCLGVTPAAPIIFQLLAIFVFPRMRQILADLEVPVPPFPASVLEHSGTIATALGVIALAVYAMGLLYLGGPRLAAWLRTDYFPVSDWAIYRLPWRRLRILRDFSAMLGILLDSQIAEPRAVTLAAASTANGLFRGRAEGVVAKLHSGMKLTDAIRSLDNQGELGWRLESAAHSPTGFRAALNGWIEALDARAFRHQQTAAQLITTGLVLLNGALVGIVIACVFQMIVAIINTAVLW